MSFPASLDAAARAWIEADPDPRTRAELQSLLDDPSAHKDLGSRLLPLEFGTAGLRGLMGAGPGRMNIAVVRRVTRGLAEHILANQAAAPARPVVVGFDARIDSDRFAEEAAGVLVAAGIPVRYFIESTPTPFVAFAAQQLGAAAAITVTASHNPAGYNGYKVYGADAAQIVAPDDADIAARTATVGPASAIPTVAGVLQGHAASPLAEPVPGDMFERYWAELTKLRAFSSPPATLDIVYTPLHGVGGAPFKQVMARAGHRHLHVVASQADPDGHFPTLPFPNPEEPGVLDQALALARESRADLVIANDPDADRMSACVPDADGSWRQLTGNQIGLLLADDLLARTPRDPEPLVVSTVVSSPLLEAIVQAHGAFLERTLTGFKWQWSAALELERAGKRFAFAFEEAIGFCPGPAVRDKDGISSGLLLADLAARCRAEGSSLLERLFGLYEQHGLWVSHGTNVVRDEAGGGARIVRAIDKLAAHPPAMLLGERIVELEDYRQGAEKRPRWRPASELIRLGLECGGRIIVRPSGTEPKLKVYVDLPAPSGPRSTLRGRERQALERAAVLGAEILKYLDLE
ncbi:MAG: phospho-sugar mutase [Polyangiaceae bacterium]|nr:phospho-sugar mutase [Polyangiaceae bacterium]